MTDTTTAIDVALFDEVTYPDGVHDIPEDAYFGARYALSCSGAKKLLPPSCPAAFRWEQEHGGRKSKAFDMGHVAHKLVLGAGGEYTAVQADDWRTKAAREARDAARAEGKTPVLARELEQAEAMAAAIRSHPTAMALLDPWSGRPEQSIFFRDDRTGVPLRARLDWLPDVVPGYRLTIPDYKTTECAHPDEFARSAGRYGYHQQHAWYTAAAQAAGLDDAPAFVFVAQEKVPPYLVSVVELDAEAVRIGANRNRWAIDTWRRCIAEDDWPGYGDDITEISLPAWSRTGDDPL